MLEQVKYDVDRQVDLVTLLKRQRKSGIALNFLMSSKTQAIASFIADRRPIDLIKINNDRSGWTHHDKLTFTETFKLGVFKLYSNIRKLKEDHVMKDKMAEQVPQGENLQVNLLKEQNFKELATKTKEESKVKASSGLLKNKKFQKK